MPGSGSNIDKHARPPTPCLVFGFPRLGLAVSRLNYMSDTQPAACFRAAANLTSILYGTGLIVGWSTMQKQPHL